MRSRQVEVPQPRFSSQNLSDNEEVPHQTYYNDEEFLGVQNLLDDADESDSFYANNFGDENTPAIEQSPTRMASQASLQVPQTQQHSASSG